MTDQVKIVSEPTGPIAPQQETTEAGKQVADRPEWLPEQFKTVEDFTKSYNELRADHTRKSQRLKELEKAQTPAENREETTEPPKEEQVSYTTDEKADETLDEGKDTSKEDEIVEGAEKALEAQGLNLTEFTSEYGSTGELSDDSRKKLNDKGFSNAMIDAYIEGVGAIRERSEAAVLQSVGLNRDQYGNMINWARTNLDAEAIKSFDESVTSGSQKKAELAVAGLKAMYESQMGKEPALVHGDNANPSNEVFNSVAEVTAAMANPKYKTDEAYRRQVAMKLDKSKHLNVQKV